jgi:hypothetical protein
MKQAELAKTLGISKSYLSMLLSGQRTIPKNLEESLSELVHKKMNSNCALQAGRRGSESRLPLHHARQGYLPF